MAPATINGIRSVQAVSQFLGFWTIPSMRPSVWRNARGDEPTLWAKHFRRPAVDVRGEIPTPSWLHAAPARALVGGGL